MSEREPRTQTPVPSSESPQDKFFRLFSAYFEQILRAQSVVASPSMIPLAESYDDLSDEDKKTVDDFMEKIKPELQEKAVQLLTNEIRDKIARIGNLTKIAKAIKKGIKPQLKRKKGCIFLQLGEGTPDDPIDEMLIANTGG